MFFNLIFLKPYFLLLLLLPFFLFLNKRKKLTNISFYAPQLKYLERSFKGVKSNINIMKFFKFYVIWLLLVMALADPNISSKESKINIDGYDLMVLIDVSESMSALDFSTKDNLLTRLDISKDVISNFVKERTYDRIGLIIFGKYAYLESPLTYDKTTINSIINSTQIGIAGPSTAIGDALALAVKKLYKKTKNSRAIILLTDGESNSGLLTADAAAKIAAKYDIPVYTIGIGKNEEAPFLNSFGQLQYAFIPLDKVTLKNIANVTKGKFYLAENKQELDNIYKEINNLTKTTIDYDSYFSYTAIYEYFILLALIIFLIYSLFQYVRYPS